jgi:hypothetical protein
MEFLETWSEERQQIALLILKPLPYTFPEGQLKKIQRSMDILAEAKEMMKNLGIPCPESWSATSESAIQKTIDEQQQIADEMCSKGLVDPAYAYALKEVDFLPRYVLH